MQFTENSITKKEPNQATSFKGKSYLVRFFIVYFFFLKHTCKLLFYYKFLKLFLNPVQIATKEEEIYKNLGLECRHLFVRLGGVYIKLGQFLSNLSHLFPPVFIESLQDLQDRVPSFPFERIKERFHREFLTEIDTVFPYIDKIPLASASTAQVHLANINQQKVVIKILYPDIESLIEKDLKTLLFIMKRINRYLYSFDYISIHKEIETTIQREMDLSLEASSIDKMRELFRDEPNIIFPMVYHQYSSRGVMVTEFIDGVKLSECFSVQKKNSKKSRPLELLIRAYILMIFKYKFFHADPHPGNLIYTKDGKLCFIDFGAVGEITESTEKGLERIIFCAISGDYYGVVEAMDQMGFFAPNADKEKLEKLARFALQNLQKFITDTDYFRNLSFDQLAPKDTFVFLRGINSSMADLLRISQVPVNFMLLHRVMGLLVGNIAWLDPYRSIFDYAKNPFYSFVGGNKIRLKQLIEDDTPEIALNLLSIPSELYRVLQTMNRERLKIKSPDIEHHTQKMYILGHQFIYTIVSAASLYFANMYAQNSNNQISYVFHAIASISFCALVISFFRNRK